MRGEMRLWAAGLAREPCQLGARPHITGPGGALSGRVSTPAGKQRAADRDSFHQRGGLREAPAIALLFHN